MRFVWRLNELFKFRVFPFPGRSSSPFSQSWTAYFKLTDGMRYFCSQTETAAEPLHSFICRHRAGIPISSDCLPSILQICSQNKDISACRQIHALMISIGFSVIPAEVCHGCIHLFAEFHALLDASLIFSCLEEPNVSSWRTIISAYVALENYSVALVLYYRMQEEGLKPNKSVYLSALKACSNSDALGEGRLIHSDILKNGMESGVVVSTILVNLYAACGSFEEAQSVFQKLPNKGVILWGALISACNQHRKGLRALELYEEMLDTGVTPDASLFSCVLKACSSIQAILLGLFIHDTVIRQNLELNVVVGNSLIDMYTKCGDLVDAYKVFESLPDKTPVTWSAILAGYASNGDSSLALELHTKMQINGISLNPYLASGLLKACGQTGNIRTGRFLHDELVKVGHETDLVVGNALLYMYGRCGGMEEAQMLFNKPCHKDDVSWGSMISVCVQANNHLSALCLFERMQQQNRVVNSIINSNALQACGGIGGILEGKVIHNQIVIQANDSDDVVSSSLVDMYAKCGCLQEAWKVFEGMHTKTSTSWGSLIDGFASQENFGHFALHLFERMQQELSEINIVMYSSALKACSAVGAFKEGRLIHNQIICGGSEIDLVAGNTLVDMYIKNGSMDCAYKVFNELNERDVVTWNSLISGYVELCDFSSALDFFQDMQRDGIRPDRITILGALKACGCVGCLAQGRLLHLSAHLDDIEVDLSMENAIMDMYCRCGSMEDAERVFTHSSNLDNVSWGTIIGGYSLQGHVEMVGKHVHNMRMQGMMADEGIFSSVFSACSLVGHVSEAIRVFVIMREDRKVTPNTLHFNCIADIISRTGGLDDAQRFLESMPVQADNVCWMSLLTSCKSHGDVKLGRKCFEEVILIEPACSAGYMLMWGLYADAQQWDEADKIMKMMHFECDPFVEEAFDMVG